MALALPEHPPRQYASANVCIYCGSTTNLHDEHIIPLALSGTWILPNASCNICGGISSAFEGTCARLILGPLRMLFDMQSRRKKERPDTLPLKVKHRPEDDWTFVSIKRDQYPFVLLFPHFEMPEELTGQPVVGRRDAAAKTFWIRGASGPQGMNAHLESLARQLHVAAIMPTGDFDVPPFCLMLAKIAHSYAVAELGIDGFAPFVAEMITTKDVSNCVQFIGGLMTAEPETQKLHELSFGTPSPVRPDIISVRIRLFACLGAPTYFVAVGRRAGADRLSR